MKRISHSKELQKKGGWVPVSELEPDIRKNRFSVDFAVGQIATPAQFEQIPQIIGWSGPAHSGTTPLLFALASHPQVDRAYFQPLKTLLRLGKPHFEFCATDRVVCLKEVMWECCVDMHDPIAMLLRAGVPASKITWITLLRDPLANFASWSRHIANPTPEGYFAVQDYTVRLYERYKKSISMHCFAYDLLAEGEQRVLRALCRALGLQQHLVSPVFRPSSIKQKLVYGQAADPAYYSAYVQAGYERGRLHYQKRHKNIVSPIVRARLKSLCDQQYYQFFLHSKEALMLAS